VLHADLSFRVDQDGQGFGFTMSMTSQTGGFSFHSDIDRGEDSGTADLEMSWGDGDSNEANGTVTIVRAKPGRPLVGDDMLAAIATAFHETGLLEEIWFRATENTDTRTKVAVHMVGVEGLGDMPPEEFKARLSGVQELFASLLPGLIAGFRATDDNGDMPPPEPPSWD
jgi:hypothetical protein